MALCITPKGAGYMPLSDEQKTLSNSNSTLSTVTLGSREKRLTKTNFVIPDWNLISSILRQPLENMELNTYPEDVTSKLVNYNLNKEKAALKKLDSSNRRMPFTVIQPQEGNHIMIHFQSGMYEIIRKMVFIYFMHLRSHKYNCSTTLLLERSSGMNVQTTYKIQHKGGGSTAYSINLYHTKSTLMANGRSCNEFIELDWPNICNIVETYEQHTGNEIHKNLNMAIKSELLKLTSALESCHIKRGNRKGTTPGGTSAHQEGSIAETGQVVSDSTFDLISQTTATGQHEQPSSILPQLQASGQHEQPRDLLSYRDTGQHEQPSNLICPTEAQGQHEQPMSTAQVNVENVTYPTGPRHDRSPHAINDSVQTKPAMNLDPWAQGRREQIANTSSVAALGRISIQPPSNDTSIDITAHNGRMEDETEYTRAERIGINALQDLDSYSNTTERPGLPAWPYHSSNHAPLTNDTPQFSQVCVTCRNGRAEFTRAQQELQVKEKKLLLQERNLKAKEKDLEKQRSQLETQKAVIASLERKVNELTATNRLLRQSLESTEAGREQGPPAHTSQNQPSPMDCQTQSLREEVNTLKGELRIRELESRMMDRLYNIEHRLMTTHSPQQNFFPQIPMAHPQYVPLHIPPHMGPPLLPHYGGPPIVQQPQWTTPNIPPSPHNPVNQNWRSGGLTRQRECNKPGTYTHMRQEHNGIPKDPHQASGTKLATHPENIPPGHLHQSVNRDRAHRIGRQEAELYYNSGAPPSVNSPTASGQHEQPRSSNFRKVSAGQHEQPSGEILEGATSDIPNYRALSNPHSGELRDLIPDLNTGVQGQQDIGARKE